MESKIIITFCVLLLVAYLFNLTASKTKIPSVILLLILGWGIRQGAIFFEFKLPTFSTVLPVLANIGLVLIVLEGSLELRLNKSGMGLLKKSFGGALLPLLALAFLLSYAFQFFGHFPLRDSLINAIPLCIISSAIAIPSVINLSSNNREYVIYESSLSDILGVIFFNFIALNRQITLNSFGEFGVQLLVIILVSIVATVSLAFLLGKIDHHVKFVPIILLVMLIYTISKVYHLPALIFILIFGLALGNIDDIKRIKWFYDFDTKPLKLEIKKFMDLTTEGTFLIRALFFMVFGYVIDTADIINTETLKWSGGIVLAIFIIRAIQLKVSSLPLAPLLFVAPRGLITVLLFLAITPADSIPFVSESLIIQVIILTTLVMTFGLMATAKGDKKLKPVEVQENKASEKVSNN